LSKVYEAAITSSNISQLQQAEAKYHEALWFAISSIQVLKPRVIVLVDEATLRKAEQLIESCEHCNREGSEIPLDNILDRITGSDPSVTDYILEVPAKCPNCRREIFEKTLVEASCQ
jgi:hypothetical protein